MGLRRFLALLVWRLKVSLESQRLSRSGQKRRHLRHPRLRTQRHYLWNDELV
jgi:hypothetical protein